jgi:hypothetical protein
MASTAEELSSQSEQLQDLIGFFEVGNGVQVRRSQGKAQLSSPVVGKGSLSLPHKHNPYQGVTVAQNKGTEHAQRYGSNDALDQEFETY